MRLVQLVALKEPQSLTFCGMAQHGSVGVNASDCMVYTPQSDYVGADDFCVISLIMGNHNNSMTILR
ncbi:MAG: hypothetical protein R2784_02190 [Saprospiraceae bacterium]